MKKLILMLAFILSLSACNPPWSDENIAAKQEQLRYDSLKVEFNSKLVDFQNGLVTNGPNGGVDTVKMLKLRVELLKILAQKQDILNTWMKPKSK